MTLILARVCTPFPSVIARRSPSTDRGSSLSIGSSFSCLVSLFLSGHTDPYMTCQHSHSDPSCSVGRYTFPGISDSHIYLYWFHSIVGECLDFPSNLLLALVPWSLPLAQLHGVMNSVLLTFAGLYFVPETINMEENIKGKPFVITFVVILVITCFST